MLASLLAWYWRQVTGEIVRQDEPHTLVLGASGFLGLHVVDAVRRAMVPVTAAHRRGGSLLLRRWKVSQVFADLDAPGGLVDAMRGHRVVIHAAGHYPARSLDPEGTLRRGLEQTERVLDACARSRVERLVYLSSMATVPPVLGRPSTELDRYPQRPEIGAYHDVKWAMEERVLAEDRLEVVVLCPGACLGPWDFRVGTAAPLVALANGQSPAMPDGIVNLTDAADVGLAALKSATLPGLPRRLLVAGHQVRLHAWMKGLAKRYGVPAPPPPLAPAVALALADSAERAAQSGARVALPREFVDLVLHGTRVDTRATERALGLSWTRLETTLSIFDAWARRLKMFPSAPPLEVQ